MNKTGRTVKNKNRTILKSHYCISTILKFRSKTNSSGTISFANRQLPCTNQGCVERRRTLLLPNVLRNFWGLIIILTLALIGRLLRPPPSGFSRIAKKGIAQRRRFLHTLLAILVTPFRKMLSPGHFRSGHQVRLSDPTFLKVCDATAATDFE